MMKENDSVVYYLNTCMGLEIWSTDGKVGEQYKKDWFLLRTIKMFVQKN